MATLSMEKKKKNETNFVVIPRFNKMEEKGELICSKYRRMGELVI